MGTTYRDWQLFAVSRSRYRTHQKSASVVQEIVCAAGHTAGSRLNRPLVHQYLQWCEVIMRTMRATRPMEHTRAERRLRLLPDLAEPSEQYLHYLGRTPASSAAIQTDRIEATHRLNVKLRTTATLVFWLTVLDFTRQCRQYIFTAGRDDDGEIYQLHLYNVLENIFHTPAVWTYTYSMPGGNRVPGCFSCSQQQQSAYKRV